MVLPFQLLVRIGLSYFFRDCVLIVKYMTFQIFFVMCGKGKMWQVNEISCVFNIGQQQGNCEEKKPKQTNRNLHHDLTGGTSVLQVEAPKLYSKRFIYLGREI